MNVDFVMAIIALEASTYYHEIKFTQFLTQQLKLNWFCSFGTGGFIGI